MKKEMTDQEFADWGIAEDEARQADLTKMHKDGITDVALSTVQKAAETRRKAVGLTRGQAARAITIGRRVKRRQSLGLAISG